MPFTYPGNPAGGSFTSPAPGRESAPGARLPSDGDGANVDSVNEAFETALDWLAFLNVGGALGDALGGSATSFDGSANPTTWNDMLTNDGAPISGLDVLPAFAAASGFAVAIGAGSGYLNTSVGIGPGESVYRTIFWAGQSVTHTTPHATLARYDAVTVTPAAFGTASALAVVTGTPAALPLAPAIPAGSAALFYVYVGASVADSTHFRACRGLGRRVGYPWSGMSSIIAGCELSWNYTADPATTTADIFVGAADQTGTNFTVNRLLIDGEAIEWAGYLSNTTNGVVVDSTANPFGSTASASFDTPYYIYAVGGRHNPMPANTGTGILNPVTICESTVAPNPRTGKPTGNLTVNGVTVSPNGAVYLGLGFVAQGTVFRRGCVMDGEMTYSLNPLQLILHNFTTNAAENMGTFTGGAQPAISTKMAVNLIFTAPTAAVGSFFLRLENFPPVVGLEAIIAGIGGGVAPASTGLLMPGQVLSFTPRFGAHLWAILNSTSIAGASLWVGAMGFNHRVNRICVGY
jgi:hypothetical protein